MGLQQIKKVERLLPEGRGWSIPGQLARGGGQRLRKSQRHGGSGGAKFKRGGVLKTSNGGGNREREERGNRICAEAEVMIGNHWECSQEAEVSGPMGGGKAEGSRPAPRQSGPAHPPRGPLEGEVGSGAVAGSPRPPGVSPSRANTDAWGFQPPNNFESGGLFGFKDSLKHTSLCLLVSKLRMHAKISIAMPQSLASTKSIYGRCGLLAMCFRPSWGFRQNCVLQ